MTMVAASIFDISAVQAALGKRKLLECEVPPVFRHLDKPSRYKGAYGGRGSGKSWDAAKRLLKYCLKKPGLRAVCVREIQRSLEQSVKRLLEDRISEYGLGPLFRVLDTHIETPGGGIIIFQGMHNHTNESIKSLEGYDIAWVEEAQTLSQRSLDLLRPTIRKEGSELWFTWNPRNEKDPVDRFLRNDPPDEAIVVKANYSDCPWFQPELKAEMEFDRARDPEKYAHIWLGEYEQMTEARVFKNWTVEAFDTPRDVVLYHGGDWGFAQDPTVLVRCFLAGRKLYVDHEVYEIGCEIEDTPALFDRLECTDLCTADYPCSGKGHASARDWTIRADSARPETISHLRRHGYPRIKAARKGPGSVEEGVKFLQSYNIVVHPRCKHVIDELTCYRFKTDPRTKAVIPQLQDKNNHLIDALRYALEEARKAIDTSKLEIPESRRPSPWLEGHTNVPMEGDDDECASDVGNPYKFGRRWR